ncbi:SDR family NAD(P)-dependent oxidoreductase [Novosphingobium sp. PASSN1]|uniref:SDR family oxidoreductase n=1 Tax=Novosphingobium sp. PASSN1 TaxID=2015561 RepID=UPI000BC55F51|nr:SDR family NAD(P)-dependent oxidoreductase [Novosphingobium sp. PASSN1]OYU37373.1 MAG: short-chain dehydrogenase [Novosphingobium sp. PASSN1]
MKLQGKTILLTGGTDGIGLRLARQLREKGAMLIVTGRNPERITAAEAEGFEVIPADLAGPDGIAAVIAGLGGRAIDILINNAGMGADHDFRVAPPVPEDDERTLWLNLHAPIRLIAALMPVLRARPEAMIVNVTSGLAIAPSAGAPLYCATKAALRSYTQGLRAQLKGTGILVLEALPPVVDTAMTAGRGNKKLSPEECARQIIAAMETGKDEANVGMVKVLRAVYSLSPALARSIMLRF